MSAKQARRLRKLTQTIIEAKLKQGETVSDETLYVEVEKNRKRAMVPSHELGKEGSMQVVSAGTVLTTPSSVRGIYKLVKKNLKR